MVAARISETDGRLDGAGGIWPNELSPAGSASGSLHEERRVDDSRESFVLRDGNAAPHLYEFADGRVVSCLYSPAADGRWRPIVRGSNTCIISDERRTNRRISGSTLDGPASTRWSNSCWIG